MGKLCIKKYTSYKKLPVVRWCTVTLIERICRNVETYNINKGYRCYRFYPMAKHPVGATKVIKFNGDPLMFN